MNGAKRSAEAVGCKNTSVGGALIWQDQGRSDEATNYQAQVLELHKEIFGDSHPKALLSMEYLAKTLHKLSRLDEAEQLLVQILELRKETVGLTHSDTLWSMGECKSISSRSIKGHHWRR